MIRRRSLPTVFPFVLAIAFVLASSAAAQDWRDDDSIWHSGGLGGPRRAVQTADVPPIVPTDWIAVPSTEGEAALAVFPWILDPARAAPVLGEAGWSAQLAPPFPTVACAFTTVVAEADEVRMARLTGARFLVVGDSAQMSVHIGDSERRGDRGVPVALKKGANRIFVVDASANWELELWKPSTRCVIATWDVGWPDVTGDEWGRIGVPIFNASTETAAYVHVHYGPAYVPTADHPSEVEEWNDGGSIAPLTILRREFFAWSLDEGEDPTPGRSGNRAPVVVYAHEDEEAAREMLCDLDPSRDRQRLTPSERDRRRSALGERPQARIPGDARLVYGTQGDAETTRALLARARFDQQLVWYECGDAPLVLADTQLVERVAGTDGWRVQTWASSSADVAPVVLYGDSAANAAWTPLRVSGGALEQDEAGVIRRNEEFYGAPLVEADAWWRAKRAIRSADPKSGTLQSEAVQSALPERQVGAFASRDAAGARLSLALGMSAVFGGAARIDVASPNGFVGVPVAGE